MIPLFGEITLWCALLFALLQATLPFLGYAYHNPYLLAIARPSAYAQFICVLMAYLLLTFAFISNDYTLTYVALNSHPALPLIYKLTAVWGAHEGSILLWILILNSWMIIFSLVKTAQSLQTLIYATLGLLSFCFLIFLIFISNPFTLSAVQLTPLDLNPLLQDPGLVSHPPMLYMGYVGFSVAFATTVAALIQGKLDHHWARVTRQFVILAWSFLTLGIILGSLWAYRVLGWGGFWFWDPVENASLLPWLSGTALIHALVLVEKRDLAKRITILLSLICFTLSLLGTFLVRSGVLISAHTFANDPKRGVFLLLLFAIITSIALVLYLVRLPRINLPAPRQLTIFSRESKLILNCALFCLAMLTVLIGTLYPLIIDALHLGTISVGAPYFNSVLLPINIVIMICMGLAPYCQWREQNLMALLRSIWVKAIMCLLIAYGLTWSFAMSRDYLNIIHLSLCFFIITSVLNQFRVRKAMAIAHTGFALLILGIVLSHVLSEEREVKLGVGRAVDLGPYQIFFLETHTKKGENYHAIQAIFDVVKNKRHIVFLKPEKRIYQVRDTVMTKVDIHPSIFRDIYIALGEPLNMNDWSLRIYHKPFIRFIWLGGVLIMIGGLLAAFTRSRSSQLT